MNTSVVICTHNRASLLADLLDCFKGQTLAPGAFELIVVDNASSDRTKEVADNASKDLKNLKYVFEPALGLSRARNTGIREAKGKIIAFIDDDSKPESNWLEVLIDTFESFSPMPVCVGGRILPEWEAPIPAWLPDGAKLQPLSLLDWGDHPLWLSTPSLGAGNLALRKIAFSRIGAFNTELGRRGSVLSSMEEILFLFQVLQEFGRQSLLYQPEAVVYHRICEDRIANRRYVVRRSYWDGASKANMKIIISGMDFSERTDSPWQQLYRYRMWGALAESAMRLARGAVYGFQALFCMDPKKLTESLVDLAFGGGGMIEIMKHFLVRSPGKNDNV